MYAALLTAGVLASGLFLLVVLIALIVASPAGALIALMVFGPVFAYSFRRPKTSMDE
jgi:hypothetical protein